MLCRVFAIFLLFLNFHAFTQLTSFIEFSNRLDSISKNLPEHQKKQASDVLFEDMAAFLKSRFAVNDSNSIAANYFYAENKSSDVRLLNFYMNAQGFTHYYILIQSEFSKSGSVFKQSTTHLTYLNKQGIISMPDWYGALYYDFIPFHVQNHTLFLLLGYIPSDLLINKKIVDVLWFDELGFPAFGAPLIKFDRMQCDRLIFQYAKMAQMTLTYDKLRQIIVYDNLAPASPLQKNNFMFYGPDGSFNAITFTGSYWMQKNNVENKAPAAK